MWSKPLILVNLLSAVKYPNHYPQMLSGQLFYVGDECIKPAVDSAAGSSSTSRQAENVNSSNHWERKEFLWCEGDRKCLSFMLRK